MSLQISARFRFGRFLLDHSAGGLFRLDRHGGAVPVMLGSRALDVLGVLVERQGELVPKQAIMDAVWPDTAVEENNLTVQISALRRVLDQGRTDGSCIQTTPGRGYRFVAAVPDPAAAPEGAPAARLELLAEPGGICISARGREEDAAGKMALEVDDLGTPELKNIAAKIQAFRFRPGAAERPALPLPDKPSLVVLPFQNISGDPEQEYFADGMVEEITTALSRVRSLFVIARNSAFTYKGRAIDVRQVGRELGVRYVLEGSVRQAGLRVRIASQLVEAATGTHLWADRFEGTLEDVFDLQDRVAASVAAAIESNLFDAEIVRAQHKPGNLQAYDLLLRAMLHMQVRTRASVTEAERLLRNALRIDPDYAPAMARLATCHWIMVSQNWVDRADPAVREMVQLARAARRGAGWLQSDGPLPYKFDSSPAGWRPQRWYRTDQQID